MALDGPFADSDSSLGVTERCAMTWNRGELTGRSAGEHLGSVLFDAEQRARIRAHLAGTRKPRVQLAREIGIPDWRLRQFLSGVEAIDGDAKKIDAWCEDKPLIYVPAEEVAVLILASWGPYHRRAADVRAIAEAVFRVWEVRKIGLPSFIYEAMLGEHIGPKHTEISASGGDS